MDPSLYAAFVLAALLISLAPGPDMLFIAANGLARGRRAGVLAALGVSTGLAIHTIAAAFGLGALIHAAPAALDVIRVLGAIFLLYLAITTWLASRRADHTELQTVRRRSLRRIYLMAALTNLANPKVIVFYLAFFPQFLTAGADAWSATTQFLLLGVSLIVVGFVVDASTGLLAGWMSERVLRRDAFQRWLSRVSAAVFGGLAVRLAVDSR